MKARTTWRASFFSSAVVASTTSSSASSIAAAESPLANFARAAARPAACDEAAPSEDVEAPPRWSVSRSAMARARRATAALSGACPSRTAERLGSRRSPSTLRAASTSRAWTAHRPSASRSAAILADSGAFSSNSLESPRRVPVLVLGRSASSLRAAYASARSCEAPAASFSASRSCSARAMTTDASSASEVPASSSGDGGARRASRATKASTTSAGWPPVKWSASLPPTTPNTVGSDLIWSESASSGSRSVSRSASATRPFVLATAVLRSGASCLHGPHQSA
mmetsp:Transcript_24883/g.98827  ORF Transcript_24883/g.98827 Transcript_24883/m.98827 type:complete len:283 (+) Transcript_24883:1040-1888(+)